MSDSENKDCEMHEEGGENFEVVDEVKGDDEIVKDEKEKETADGEDGDEDGDEEEGDDKGKDDKKDGEKKKKGKLIKF